MRCRLVNPEGEMARGMVMVGMLVEDVGEFGRPVGLCGPLCCSSRDVNTVIVVGEMPEGDRTSQDM